ncbi:phospholipid carrier-dependent glycosyltransferase [Paenibacillus lupini]|uniref:phospholipid carrier-dependent glycosyltransferase n=1 Tax=Paenibacillus lupini TaxID=1450204 RepID=UPI001FBA695A|nr:phospholipid carrier-dependent glycosyltransferase [Paenibacillus lupini]NIK26619.1 Gpi18-like mannosyltransferase [Paenibacillus lupini]
MWKLRAIIGLLFVLVIGLLPAITGYTAAAAEGSSTTGLGNIATEAFSPIISMEPVQSSSAAPQEKTVDPKKISAFPVLAVSALFGALFAYLYSRWLRAREFSSGGKFIAPGSKPSMNGMRIALLAAFAFRFYIAVSNPGYTNDINTFIFWANHAYTDGLSHFYQEGLFADYPPGYIYVLYVLGAIQSWAGIDSASDAALLLYKLPAIAADLITGYLIYRTAQKKLDHRAAFGLAMLYIWNPAVWINSAGWGQVDSFFALILVLAIHAITNGKLERGSIWFALAVLVKPQALIFSPVMLLAYGYNLKAWKRVAAGIGYGAVAFLLLAAPFIWSNGGLHALYNLYKSTLSSYPYATLNAFNLYALTGGNWAKLDQQWLGLQYATWGNVGIVFATVASILFFAARKQQKDLSGSFYMAMILIVTVFMFAAKMHERYMFPALLLMIFAYIEAKDRRILHLLFGFSVTHFINVGYVLVFSQANAFLPSSDGILIVTSLCNVGLYIYMLYIGYDRYIRGQQLAVPVITKAELERSEEHLLQGVRAESEPPKRRFQRKDWLWMSIITVIYAVIALSNLGSTVSFDSGWKADRDGQSFYVDFGKPVQISQVNSFNGVGVGKYKWEFSSSTPDQWSNPIEIEQKVGDNLKWTVNPINQTVRYAKLTVTKWGFTMQEAAFYSEGSDQPILIQQIVDVDGSDEADKALQGSRLFDEQANAVYKSTYKNSSYFDEIYHARTAYENLHGIKAYENTHPPLGKLLIAVGIKLFGLSPFGWRIMGTLFGIGMLPIIYLFALQLFRKTGYAATATILFAADFMHFTQTRIATIDVYGVFFIMLMFYFMNKYREMSFYRSPLRKTLVPLFWAGLLFGIGVASKWIVIYGGAGLAVMLALVLIERYREQAAARRILKSREEGASSLHDGEYHHATRSFVRNTILTLVSCVVFFVVIPLIIYCLSYIPVLDVKGDTYTAERLVEYQEHMYDYHSKLVATHPYSSQWWEWPFMKRPVWYYNGKNLDHAGDVSSISAFGNPLIWWTGIFAVIAAFYISIKRKDKRMYVLWIAYLSQYLPWMLVPRLTFLYHYFAMVPFMILAIVYIFTRFEDGRDHRKWIRWLYAGIAVVLFIMYYPVISGMEVSKDYVMIALRHFDSWVFYS